MKKINKNDILNSISARRRSKDTEFLYASAYIRSVEEKGLCKELLNRMLEAQSVSEAESMLHDAYPKGSADTVCDEIVNEAYDTVDELVSDAEMFSFMRYPYDANNVKSAIKCAAKGISAEGMLFGCGTFHADDYVKMAESNDFSALPEKLGKAASNAAELYKKTGDPQTIDLPIDKACLSLMAEAAARTGSRFISEAVKCKIDISNILSAKRVIRMGGETVKGTLERTLSCGGNIPCEKIVEASVSENAESELEKVISEIAPRLAEPLSLERLGDVERELENRYLETVYAAKNVPFGCEIPFAYLVSSEYNAKNARIILAGKRAGLEPEQIRERMRIYYV